jgi:hypothetical protein
VRVRSLDPDEVAAGREIEPSERKPGDRLVYNHAHRFALYLCTLFAIGIPSVAAAGAVYLLARRHGGGHRPAATVALTYALATPAFPYSTALYGHQLCGSLLIVAFAICVLLPRESGARRRRAALVAGALLGMAGMTEYPALVAVAALAGFAMVRHGWRFAFWVVLGGTPFAIALALYHTAAFGSPLATGYDFVYLEQFAEGMRVRYGIGMPDPRVALAITFGAYRGLFYASPVLLLAAWGLVADLRDPMRRLVAATATLVVAFFVLLNAGYYMWDGGAAIGPRHVVPALAFLALGLVRAHAAVPWALGVLAVVSALQMLLAAAAAPEASQHGNPLWGYALERVLGHTPGPGVRATNLGVLLGLPGLASLLPLLALWLWAWRSIAETRPQR